MQSVSFEFVAANPYVSDLNQNLLVNSRFNAPPDIDGIAAGVIVTAAGGVITTEKNICSDGRLGKLRKLRFIRQSGNSMSIAIGDKTNLIAAATTIKGVLDGANGGSNPVACIELIGEQFLNLNDELGLVFDGTTFAPTHKAPATANKQNFASGVISYEADANQIFGATITQNIKSITEKPTNDFSDQLGAAAAGCIGDFVTLVNCGGNGRRNPRSHRRYKLSFLTKVDTGDAAEASKTETIDVPVAGAGALDILACGTSLIALPGLFCIGYQGESYSRFHKLLA